MNVVRFYETLARLIGEREGVKVKITVERKVDDERDKTIPTPTKRTG